MDNLPETQLTILRVLLFNPTARFTDLNTLDISSDHFSYHVRKLVAANLIIKNAQDLYELTELGKGMAGKMDGVSKKIEEQTKTVVVAICTRVEQGVKQYLIQKRKKQPMYGYHCLPGGKSRLGETLIEAVLRELHEETGLTGTAQLKHIHHTIKTSRQTHKIISDDILYCFEVTNLQGELITSNQEGENFWLTETQITQLDQVLLHTLTALKAVNDSQLQYEEERFEYDVV